MGVLTAGALVSALVSVATAPRFFDAPAANPGSAAATLRHAVIVTESLKSFTEVTYQRGQNPSAVVYQSPDTSYIKPLPDFPIVSEGQYTYVRDNCTKRLWERVRTPFQYGPGNALYDLDLLLTAQRVTRRGDRFVAQYVPSFPSIEVDIIANVQRNKVVAEKEVFTYGKGTNWYLRPWTTPNIAYTVRYSHFDSSELITVPSRRQLVKSNPNEPEAFRGCGSFVAVSTFLPTDFSATTP
jgi:hypothetical protein